MASAKTLNAKNLEALGAERLAALLIEIATGDATIKRRLRLALAGEASPADVAREVTKRLATIARARGFVDWTRIKAFIADLAMQHQAIMTSIAPRDPQTALDLLWRFTACGDSIYDRCGDSHGELDMIFQDATHDIGLIAAALNSDPILLADQAFEAIRNDRHAIYHVLVSALAPALGDAGLARLRARALEWQAEPMPQPPENQRKVIAYGSGGAFYEDQLAAHRHRYGSERLLKAIAEASGDLDAWIAQHSLTARQMPGPALSIAQRLLSAGRAGEALAALDAVKVQDRKWLPPEWDEVRLAVLEALGQSAEAQDYRWQCFATTLDAGHLRDYLKRLPDFEDFEAEQRALAHAYAFPDVEYAIAFLSAWPALDRAARLVVGRAATIDGHRYECLTHAADALETQYPLAATILRRSMIDFALVNARSARYRHAARHLADCATAARRIADFGTVPDHDRYVAGLRADHGRKHGFWSLVDKG